MTISTIAMVYCRYCCCCSYHHYSNLHLHSAAPKVPLLACKCMYVRHRYKQVNIGRCTCAYTYTHTMNLLYVCVHVPIDPFTRFFALSIQALTCVCYVCCDFCLTYHVCAYLNCSSCFTISLPPRRETASADECLRSARCKGLGLEVSSL